MQTTLVDIMVDGFFYAQHRHRHMGRIDPAVLEMEIREKYPSLKFKGPGRVEAVVGARPA